MQRMEKQLCYYEDSPAAAIAAHIEDSYRRVGVGRGQVPPGLGHVATVWLADPECDSRDLEALVRQGADLRVIYLAKADSLQSAPEWKKPDRS